MTQTTWSETDALTSRRTSEQQAQRAASARLAYGDAYTRAIRTGATKEQAHEAGVAAQTAHAAPAVEHAQPALAVVPAPRTAGIVCTEGSCLHSRPGTPCDCTCCFGADHGARSTLAPAACKGTRMLAELGPRGGYRYPRCPGCQDCARPRLVLVGATTRDPFRTIPGAHGTDLPW